MCFCSQLPVNNEGDCVFAHSYLPSFRMRCCVNWWPLTPKPWITCCGGSPRNSGTTHTPKSGPHGFGWGSRNNMGIGIFIWPNLFLSTQTYRFIQTLIIIVTKHLKDKYLHCISFSETHNKVIGMQNNKSFMKSACFVLILIVHILEPWSLFEL